MKIVKKLTEVESEAGDNIFEVLVFLINNAPAWVVFNGIRIEANGTETASELMSCWHTRQREIGDAMKQVEDANANLAAVQARPVKVP